MRLGLLLVLSTLVSTPLWAADTMRQVITPSDDSIVLESLPSGPRISAPTTPTNTRSLASQLERVQSLLTIARQQGDPRYLGYADAQLRVLLAKYPADLGTQLLQARLLQANHHFDAAERVLNTLLASPSAVHSEAALMSASIALVQGRYAHATKRCHQLTGLAMLPFSLICQAQVQGATGQASEALARLNALPAKQLGLTSDQRTWWRLSQADMADRLGSDNSAETDYREAAAAGSAEAVAAYADWLFWQGHARDSLSLLAPWTAHDGLLSLLTRAEQQLGLSKPAAAHKQQALGRWQAFLARGEPGHERELATFYLDVMQQPATALRLAQRNWTVQRETADYRIYIRAALAQSAKKDLAILAKWQASTKFEDVRVQRWLSAGNAALPSSNK